MKGIKFQSVSEVKEPSPQSISGNLYTTTSSTTRTMVDIECDIIEPKRSLINHQWMCTIPTLGYEFEKPRYYKVVSNQINSINVKIKNSINKQLIEKSVGTTELHYSTKKRYHVLTILKSFFRPTLVRV